jgi:molecular chaperone DnaK
VHVLADEKGSRLLPSVVSFHPNGEVLVGAVAKARRIIDARNTVYSHKRLIGRSWGSPEIAQARTRFPFELREGPGQGPLIHSRGQDYTLPEVSAFVLKRARQIAETALGATVERAVITVPAHFNELQRASTKVAGRVSGLEVLRILNEPTAAALAYGLGRSGNERVAVYDFGGGTFDCTLLDLNGNVFEVLATAGDSFLGGDDIDNMIADRMAEVFLRQHRQDVRVDPQLNERLKASAEEVKIALTSAETHTVVLKDFGHAAGGNSITFQFSLSRKDLETMMTPLVDRSFKVTQDALALARLSPSSFDKVILVGGSTRVPLIRKRVADFFGTTPMDRVNPDEVVAIGAAIQAAALTEGVRRRSIPAPPTPSQRPQALPQPNQPSVGEAPEDTRTSEVATDPMKPAFGNEQPGFGAARPPVVPPPATARTGPARPRTASNASVPVTQPMGARPAPKPPAPQPPSDDSSSFPDLSPPTPFEWFPSGTPSSGDTKTRGASPTSERTFGGDPKPPVLSARTGATPARPAPPPPPPPSSRSSPSFPSATSPGGHAAVGTPAASSGGVASEPAPFELPKKRDRPKSFSDDISEPFGEIQDVSLVSTTGVSTSGLASDEEFGHISDLSLISGPGGSDRRGLPPLDSGEIDDPTKVRRDQEPPIGFGNTLQLDPGKNPNPLLDREDLPAVAPKPKPARSAAPAGPTSGRGLGIRPDGSSPMSGKAPPLIAPQPFGPMEKLDDAPRTASLQSPQGRPPPGKPPPSPISKAPVPPPNVQPPPQPHAFNTTVPLGVPTAPAPVTASMGAMTKPSTEQAPPPAMAPPAYPFAYNSGPPPAAYVQPEEQVSNYGSQPPVFGQFPSAPPEAAPQAAAPPHPGAPAGIQYQSPVLVDVTPRGLVVETAGGYTDTIIPRNSKIPCERTRRFATGRDMQTTVRVRVAQGESPNFPQNTYLGEVELSGLRPAARGEVTVAVTFEVDADGSVRVRARDVQTGQEARATLKLIGVADESSVVMMINRFAQQPVVGGPTQ